MTNAWYPSPDDYFAVDQHEELPVRQGDLLEAAGSLVSPSGKPWLGCIVIHPSCEIVSDKVERVQVCRVRRLRETSHRFQEYIADGQRTDDDGHPLVAMAHTFFLPPASDDAPFHEPMFADFREVALVSIEQVSKQYRVAALTHEARVCFIRRSLYWRQRWLLEYETVQGFESDRISDDAAFVGPRPAWAASDSQPS